MLHLFPQDPKATWDHIFFYGRLLQLVCTLPCNPDFMTAGTDSKQSLTKHQNTTKLPTKWKHSRNEGVGEALLVTAKGILHQHGFSLYRFLGHSFSRWITSYSETEISDYTVGRPVGSSWYKRVLEPEGSGDVMLSKVPALQWGAVRKDPAEWIFNQKLGDKTCLGLALQNYLKTSLRWQQGVWRILYSSYLQRLHRNQQPQAFISSTVTWKL